MQRSIEGMNILAHKGSVSFFILHVSATGGCWRSWDRLEPDTPPLPPITASVEHQLVGRTATASAFNGPKQSTLLTECRSVPQDCGSSSFLTTRLRKKGCARRSCLMNGFTVYVVPFDYHIMVQIEYLLFPWCDSIHNKINQKSIISEFQQKLYFRPFAKTQWGTTRQLETCPFSWIA